MTAGTAPVGTYPLTVTGTRSAVANMTSGILDAGVLIYLEAAPTPTYNPHHNTRRRLSATQLPYDLRNLRVRG